MKKLYFENQLFLTRVALIGLSIVSFYYYQNNKIKNEEITEKRVIVEKSGHSYKRGSSLTIKRNDAYYHLKFGKYDNQQFSVGDTIDVYYNKQFDYCFLPSRVEQNFKQFLYVLVTFFLLLIPWKYILSKANFLKNK